MQMWLLVASACWWAPPAATSTSGMAGVIREPGGRPVEGLLVETVESTVRTDAEGRFGLYYKRPDTHVHFVWQDTWYRRRYRAADEGREVEILLPPTRALQVVCGAFTCDVELRWDFSDGLTAKSRARCEPDANPVVRGAPQGVPDVVCRDGAASPPQPLSAAFSTDRLELRPPPRDVQLELVFDGEAPSRCEVAIGSRRATYAGSPVPIPVNGEALAEAICDARPAVPVRVAADADAVQLRWTADGPTLQPPAGLELEHIEVVGEAWTLRSRAASDGSFLLPPLPAGAYRVQLHGGAPTEARVPVKPGPPGTLYGQRLATGPFVGVLVLAELIGDGVIDVVELD